MKALMIFASLLLFLSTKTYAFCFASAGETYQIDPLLLIAISQVESSLNPKAINFNKKGGKVLSEDIGLMQINSTWMPELSKKWGINKDKLLNDPCQNVYVGAYILAQNISKNGVNWKSIGAYNAGFKDANEVYRMKYAKKVSDVYAKFLMGNRQLIIVKASRGELIK